MCCHERNHTYLGKMSTYEIWNSEWALTVPGCFYPPLLFRKWQFIVQGAAGLPLAEKWWRLEIRSPLLTLPNGHTLLIFSHKSTIRLRWKTCIASSFDFSLPTPWGTSWGIPASLLLRERFTVTYPLLSWGTITGTTVERGTQWTFK